MRVKKLTSERVVLLISFLWPLMGNRVNFTHSSNFLSSSRPVCYRMIDWKKGLDSLNENASKSLEFFRTSVAGTLVLRPGQCTMLEYC